MKNLKNVISQPHGFKVWKGVLKLMRVFHSHSDLEINYILNGRAKYIHGGKFYEILPNQFAIFWGGVPHSVVEVEENSETIWLTLPIEWIVTWYIKGNLIEKLLAGEMIIQPIEQKNIAYESTLLNNWVEEYNLNNNDYLKNIQLELEVKIRRLNQWLESSKYNYQLPTTTVHKNFHHLIELISNQYLTINNMDELGGQLSMHPKYLTQMFKKHTDINAWDYIVHLRIAHAQRLLITSKKKIIDICFESGFQTTSNFYSIFKKYNNETSPAAYRKRIQG
ncbi:MAG: hypothetical protein COA79_03310 [Planctomycetota bacterium]|nr:MAG: hypothetical protein COA79_03310 [Planctomycetota bacterium]